MRTTLDFEIRLNDRGFVVVAPGELEPRPRDESGRAKLWLLGGLVWAAVWAMVALVTIH